MNSLDIILIAILIFSLGYSIIKGAIRTICRILALFFGYFAAYKLSYIISPWLGKFIKTPVLRESAASFILFISVFFAFILLGTLLYYLIKLIKLKLFDRILGGFVGINLGFLVGWATIMILLLFMNLNAPFFKESRFTPYFLEFGKFYNKYLPRSWTYSVEDKYKDFKKSFKATGDSSDMQKYKDLTKDPSKLKKELKGLN